MRENKVGESRLADWEEVEEEIVKWEDVRVEKT